MEFVHTIERENSHFSKSRHRPKQRVTLDNHQWYVSKNSRKPSAHLCTILKQMVFDFTFPDILFTSFFYFIVGINSKRHVPNSIAGSRRLRNCGLWLNFQKPYHKSWWIYSSTT
ncbi:hypothetical protein CEXT_173961 [Caerostris extrusa]|uniref:Uncharacterized protein n=1 Tax=Caerostris extrusa TaxID=172846 RepID=A0AAV4R2L6_CAEEX|nr:hypothetical protein CEXT_173961 [Caerostris extrusa]